MKVFMSLLLTITAAQLLAGNDHPNRCHSYKKFPRTQNNQSVVDSIIKKRTAIWSSSFLTKENRQHNILSLYNDSVAQLKTAEDYLLLLKDTKHLAPTTDVFISSNIHEFFSINPTLAQVVELISLSTLPDTIIKIKTQALVQLRNPTEFIMLIQASNGKNNKLYKKSTTQFISTNIETFTNANPTIDNVLDLQRYILASQVDLNRTVDVLAALKNILITKFSGDDLIKLLNYGCETPAPIYISITQKLIAKNLQSILNSDLKLAQLWELKEMLDDPATIRALRKHCLSLVKTPYDFISIVSDFKAPKVLDKTVMNFIKDNLAIFKNTKPTIDDVMALHSFVIKNNFETENTVATLIKLKETFCTDFVGSDLNRLLGYGTENPWNQYVEQLEMFKSMKTLRLED